MDASEIVYAAGMSVRPEFYSGRGATYSDLDSTKLTKIHAGIVRDHGEAAGRAFVTMVADITVLSATAFLQCLYGLEANDWVWDKASNPVRHFCVLNDDENPERTLLHGEINVIEALVRHDKARRIAENPGLEPVLGPVDNTAAIRGPFLSQHGVRRDDDGWMTGRRRFKRWSAGGGR